MIRRSSLAWVLMAAFASGCGDGAAADLTAPDAGPARAALIVSLDAWKADRRDSGVLIGEKPAVGVVDSARAERPLIGYEVVGPLMVAAKARPFAVRLVLGSPEETVTARYLVIGRDPLWVFRQEDFDRMIHWEHKMPPAEPTPGEPAATDAR